MDGGCSTLAACLALRAMPQSSSRRPRQRSLRFGSALALRVVLRSRGARLAMLGYFGHMWELYAMWTWIAAFAAASLQSATGRAGSAVAFVAIATGSVGCVLAGRWADQLGKARVAGAA